MMGASGQTVRLLRFSKSQIVMFSHCAAQWRFAYKEKLKRPPGSALKVGAHYHETVARNYKQKATSQKDLPLDEQTDYFRQAWKDDAEMSEVKWDEGETSDAVKEVGTGLVAAHHRSIAPKVTPQSEATVEEEIRQLIVKPVGGKSQIFNLSGSWREAGQQGERIFEKELSDHELEYAYLFDSIIDITDSAGVVRENKTAARMMSQADADKLIDLSQYAVAKRIQTGKVETGLAVDIAIKNKNPKAETVTTQRSIEQIRFHLDRIGHMSRSINAESFPPNTDWWGCSPKYCGYWSICAGRGAVTVDMKVEEKLRGSVK
jgi:PD-(D/E)XK nuclease superfamily